MNYFQIKQNNLNLILISFIFLGSFFFQSSIISFKIIYALQALIIFFFFIKYSEVKIHKQIIILNMGVLSLIFFNFDKSYIYFILICFLNAIFTFDKIKRINLKHNLVILFAFTIIMILCFKTTTYRDGNLVELFLFEEVLFNYNHYKACLLADETARLNNLSRVDECAFQFKRLRYTFLGLHSNLTAIFCLIITFILLKDLRKKRFIILFSVFSLIFLYFTLSKSGLLFYIIILLLTFIKVSYKILLLLFFGFNLFLGIISHKVSSSVSDFWAKKSHAGIIAYQEEFCPKIMNVPIINYFNDCETEKNVFIEKMQKFPQLLIFNFMGYSTFYKLHSNGMVVDSMLNNLRYYLFPDPLNKLEADKKIHKKDITSKLSPHGLFFMAFLKYGIILGIIFL